MSQYAIASDGALTALTSTTVAAGTSPVGISIDASAKYAYVTNQGVLGAPQSSVSQYIIGTDGGLTAMTPATVVTNALPIAIVTTGKWQ